MLLPARMRFQPLLSRLFAVICCWQEINSTLLARLAFKLDLIQKQGSWPRDLTVGFSLSNTQDLGVRIGVVNHSPPFY